MGKKQAPSKTKQATTNNKETEQTTEHEHNNTLDPSTFQSRVTHCISTLHERIKADVAYTCVIKCSGVVYMVTVMFSRQESELLY